MSAERLPVAACRKRNDYFVSSWSNGKAHVMEMRFWIPSLESEQTFEAARQKNGGPQHVFTQKIISQQRLVSCACISGASTLYCSSRVHSRLLTRDPGLTILYFLLSLISARPPPHPSHQKCEYETEKWRREGRSRFLSARHWRLEGEVGGGKGWAGDDATDSPPPHVESEVSIMFPWHSCRTFCMTNDKAAMSSSQGNNLQHTLQAYL